MPFFVGLPLLSVFLCAAPVAGGTLQELSCWLEKTGGEMIGKAARKMHDGRIVYAPQVGDWYKAAWLRDYVMMLEGGLVPKERQNAVAELFLSAVTPEGEGFDCIKFDGTVVRRPGYDTVGDKSVMDGYTYITTLIYETWRQTRDGKWLRMESVCGVETKEMRDVTSGAVVARDCDSFTCALEQFQTAVFLLVDR